MQRLKQVLVSFLRSTIFVWINVLRRYRLRRYKYVHLMFNDKFNKPFVDFLNKYFNPDEHLVICERILRHPFPVGKNVMKVWTFKGLDLGYKNIEKIICHSLCEHELVDILYAHKDWLAKSYWMIWGGDLYDAPRNVVDDYVRSHFAGWITDTDGDDLRAAEKYGAPKQVFRAGYTFPVSWEVVERVSKKDRPNDGMLRVQINNSSDESTLPIMRILSELGSDKIVVRTILSYGSEEHRAQIRLLGAKLFGSRFEALESMRTPEKYAEWCLKNDILILNQNRQQGIGNAFLALALGTKVFIRSDVTTFDHFRMRGISVYDTRSLGGMSVGELEAQTQEEKAKNRKLVSSFFSGDDLSRLWSPIFAK